MGLAVDRREHERSRVPFEAPIQLIHADYEEPFEAASVDLSSGGLGLRSSCLPEVGTRLFCGFACLPGDQSVRAYGEVVWARLDGVRSGQFGVRFLEIDPGAEASIARLLAAQAGPPVQGEQIGGGEARDERVQKGSVAKPDPALTLLQSAQVEVLIDGTGVPIHASLVADDADALVLEQELPLLQCGRGVQLNGGGREGRYHITHVELRVVNATPRLVFRLAEDVDRRVSDVAPAVDRRVSDVAPAVDRRVSDVAPIMHRTLETYPDADELELEPEDLGEDDAGGRMPEPLREAAQAPERAPVPRLTSLLLWVARARAFVGLLGTQGGATFGAAWQALRRALAVLRQQCAGLLQALRARMPRRRRRTTAGVRPDGAPPAKRHTKRRGTPGLPSWVRVALLGTMAFSGVAFGVYALAPHTRSERIPVHRSVRVHADPAPGKAADWGAGQARAAEMAAAPGSKPPGTEPSEPRTERTSATGAADPASPETGVQAEPVGDGPPRFGAAQVPKARRFTLRMTDPVKALRGTLREDGFSVVIPGSLSLDRAGPISAAHPAVRRSMILNHGEHSELTVLFASGHSPAFQITGKGASLEILIQSL